MARKIIAPWVRLVREPGNCPLPDSRIRSPEDVVKILAPRLRVEEIEVFCILVLNSQSHVRAISEISRGLLNSSLVHPREVFRVAIAMGGAGIILAHNHPRRQVYLFRYSGVTMKVMTIRELRTAIAACNYQMLDVVVLTPDGGYQNVVSADIGQDAEGDFVFLITLEGGK